MVFCISVYTSNHQSETRRKRKGLSLAIRFVFKACYLFGNDQFLPGPKIRRKSFSHLLPRKHKWSDQNLITYLRLSRDQQELYPPSKSKPTLLIHDYRYGNEMSTNANVRKAQKIQKIRLLFERKRRN